MKPLKQESENEKFEESFGRGAYVAFLRAQ
jgi:hypothetical protein